MAHGDGTMASDGTADDDLILGWCRDPFGLHDCRWISRGAPTSLVRDGRQESNDPPPTDRDPIRPFEPVETTFGSSDTRRAGQSTGTTGEPDYGMSAMDANVAFGAAGVSNGIAPTDGGPLSAWPTAFEAKMRKRAKKQRRAERRERWKRRFGGGA